MFAFRCCHVELVEPREVHFHQHLVLVNFGEQSPEDQFVESLTAAICGFQVSEQS